MRQEDHFDHRSPPSGPAGPGAPRVTLKEIAAHAGVSRSTVSLVMQESPLVAETTRTRVQASAQALGYVYNRGAAMLRSARTATVGVVVHDIANPFFGAMVAGIDDVLQAAGYVPFLANSGDSPARQERFLTRMREQHVDALLLCPAEETPPALIDTLATWQLPCIQLMRHLGETPQGDYVGADIRQGVHDAVAHLVSLGHRHITLLAGDSDHSADRERLDGYRQAMQAAGLEVESRVLRGELTRGAGLQRTLALLDEAAAPTALICHNDLVALGAILALQRRGLRPGLDCAVVGIDDIDEAALTHPALTSVATHPEAIGRAAAELALARIADPQGAPARIVLPATLEIRDTTSTSPRREQESS
ncbi:LacI family DNA-binding transcriptional regulator [Salinicola avicenniae]|uniref:LacI family DNA-binding transcriptional regulator n=1 Tax=Salinicola avicenniae TaxID=2916836 RepID=UPI002072C266|nr:MULTISPECIES: LacI family DNA-binding transcriptional regulator [unclassified Salinicola]